MKTQQFSDRQLHIGSLVVVLAFVLTAVSGSEARAQLTCPANITAPTDPGQCDVRVNFTVPSNCDDAVFCSPEPTSPFQVGETAVDCFCTDDDETCDFLVTVRDEERPTVGTVTPINSCYPTVAAAQAAGLAKVAAVDADNCALVDPIVKTSAINNQCGLSFNVVAKDVNGNESDPVGFGARVDGEAPTSSCRILEDLIEVSDQCGGIIHFRGELHDNCCLEFVSATPKVTIVSGAADITVDEQSDCSIRYATGPDGAVPNMILVECNVPISGVTQCPVIVKMELIGNDCCGNPVESPCSDTVTVLDSTKPRIQCPPSITLERGDKICNDDVKNWLDSAVATDNCDGEPTITNDSPECGFPAGQTTTVTFTAKDDCGNTSSCTSDITIAPLRRGSGDQKGSLLVFSDVEIRWNDAGQLAQDTILDISNDASEGSVDVQAWFINGDRPLDEIIDLNTGTMLQEFEPGWNTADCRFELTKNQPHFWSAAKGSNKCQPFTVLDENGRPGGSRVLRGYVVMVAVKFTSTNPGMTAGAEDPRFYQEIRWNHLKGDAVVIDYEHGAAWEYNAMAYQARCGETGQPLLDCVKHDADGTCCEAAIRPGRLDMDGFQYDANFDVLLLDFYASGSTAFTRGNVTVMVDTDLTLHTVDTDLRQDGNGPVLIKADFEIYNENESKFSGLRRCICCWDQTLLSNYVRDVSIPSYFLRSVLRTDKGMARINGVFSEECDYEEVCGFQPTRALAVKLGASRPLLGVAAKELTFSGTTENRETAGMNLPGSGTESATIRFDVPAFCGDGEVNQPDEQCDDGNSEECDGCTSDCTRRACDTCGGEPPCVANIDCVSGFECVNGCCRECLGRACEDNTDCDLGFECAHGCCRPID